MAFCRICLSDAPGLDIKQLNTSNIHGNISYIKMILFCLDIQVKEDEKTKKICTTCVDKLLQFYTFKSMALKNNEYLKTADPECIVKQNKGLLIKEEKDTKFTVGNTLIRKVSSSSKKTFEIEVDTKNLLVKSESDVKYELMKQFDESDDDVIFDDSFSFDWRSDEKETKKRITPNPKKRQNTNIKNSTEKPRKYNKIKIIKNNYGNSKANSTKIDITSPSTRPIKKKPDNGIQCVDCKHKFFTQASLHEHICSRKFIPRCKTCGIIFKTRAEHYSHKKKEHKNDEPKRLLCHICSRGFDHKSTLEYHIRRHMNLKPYKCTDCAMSFVVISGLNRHKLTHTDAKNYVHCKLCNRGFSNKRYLDRHQAVHDHSKRPEKKHRCSYCDKMLLSPYERRKHEATHTKHADDENV